MVALLAAPLVASADDTTKKTTSTDKTAPKAEKITDADLQVMSELHHVNQMEIDMGKLAETKGSTQPVKSYGKMLVTDHTSADKDLTALAKKHGQTIPMFKPTNEADQKDDKDDKDMAAHVKTLKGADFDKDFLSMMVQGHEKVLAKLDTAIGMVTSDELKTAIQNVKPTIQKHADQARDLQKTNPQAMK
jgi:putative membrane protein